MNTRSSKSILKLASGDIIDGRFEISSNPVRRSFGIAYLAVDIQSQNRRTLLFISPAIYHDAEAMEFIREETQLIRWLDHPLIARLYDLHSEGEFAYFELEYVRGKNLKEKKIANPQKKLSENIVKWLGLQILEALAYAHDQNIIHRDLRPQNVALTPDGKVKLIDFGISETLRTSVSMVWDTTAQTTILYMAPEQLQGKQIGVQADLYSVAATMYDLLNGKPPFYFGDVYTQILREEAKPIEGLPADLNQILLKGLAKDPAQRYAAAREMKAALMRSGVHYQPAAGQPPKQKTPRSAEKKPPAQRFAFFSLNPTLKMLSWTVLIVIALALVISRYKEIRALTGKLTTANQVRQAADRTQFKLNQALLQAGNEKIRAGNLFEPPGNNALELFRKVLQHSPENQKAVKAVQRIKKAMLNQIKTRLKQGHTTEARNLFNKTSALFPGDPALDALQAAVFHFSARLVVLNGTGGKGIAHRLSAKLQKQGFTVLKEANYLRKGRPYWRIGQTKFYGNVPPNKTIRKIEANLGVAYKRSTDKRLFNNGNNLVVILGRDYRRLNILGE